MAMATNKVQPELSIGDLATAQSPLLDLPAELREMIFQHCYESVLLYTRSTCSGKGWYKQLECHNPCPELLLVSKQVSAEAFTAMLQACVLDIWGSTNFRNALSTLPLLTKHIRNVAVTAVRIHDFQACIPHLPSLEYLFIDAVPVTASSSISTWRTIIDGSRNQGRRVEAPAWAIDLVIQELFSAKAMEARERPLHVYLRCTTYDEETVLLMTDPAKPPQKWTGVVPKFLHKFPRK